jgi:hypothetical protein
LAFCKLGCGNTVFVDPDRALKASLVFTHIERLVVMGDDRSYFEVHIANRTAIDRVRLYAEGPSTRVALPMDGAIVQPCFDRETCISLTLGPGVPMEVDHLALEVPEIGHRLASRLTVSTLTGYDLSGAAQAGNQTVEVEVDDPIRRHFPSLEPSNTIDDSGNVIGMGTILIFPRTFDALASSGGCGLPAGPTAEGWTTESSTPFAIAASFSGGSDPLTCISIRPTHPKGGNAIGALTIGARAVVTRFQHVYTPPVEISPLVYLPLFDLELPTVDRCNAAESLVETAIMDAATDLATEAMMGGSSGAEIMMLPAVQIANASGVLCHQSNDRTFDGMAVASQAESALVDRFGGTRRVRVVLVYATNLDLDLPPSLVSAFQSLRAGFDGSIDPNHRDLLLGIAPEKPLMFLTPDRSMDWLATDEPSFRGAIKTVLKDVWPFRTVVHTDQTIVPLTTDDQRGRFREYRICSASKDVTPIGMKLPDLTVIEVGPDGPAYRVSLPEEVLVESLGFMIPSVSVGWEGCEALCDHPAPSGDGVTPWTRAPGCG